MSGTGDNGQARRRLLITAGMGSSFVGLTQIMQIGQPLPASLRVAAIAFAASLPVFAFCLMVSYLADERDPGPRFLDPVVGYGLFLVGLLFIVYYAEPYAAYALGLSYLASAWPFSKWYSGVRSPNKVR